MQQFISLYDMGIWAKYNWTGVAVFVTCIIIAHLYSETPYSWKNNTISELASQGYRYRWIMKTGFIVFGIIMASGIIMKLNAGRGLVMAEMLLLLYSVGILVSGLYSTKPFMEGVPYSAYESMIHSYAAQIAGLSFSLSLLAYAIFEKNPSIKTIHFIVLCLVVGLSAYFGMAKQNAGIIQRAMYMVSFLWLAFWYD